MQPKVSVIIPIYNVDRYLNNCLDSVVSQTLKEIEIICVDDASTDNGLAIIKEYALKDKRIKIIKNSFNQGLSVTRNVGVNASNGEYIYFLDSDDLIAVNALEVLYKKCKVDSLDILMFDAEVFWDNESIKESVNWSVSRYKRKYTYNDVLSGKEYFDLLHKNQDYKVNVQLLFINKQFYFDNNLRFKEGILHEDNLFTFISLLKANRVAHISEAFYKRRVREGSIMTVKESFKNVYGYFIVHLEMLKIVDEVRLSDAYASVAVEEAFKMLRMARKIFINLNNEERTKYLTIKSHQKIIFEEIVANVVLRERKFDEIKKQNTSLLKLRQELEHKNNGLVTSITVSNNKVKFLEHKEKELIKDIKIKCKEKDVLAKELLNIKNGASFKIGRILTWLPRKLLGRK